MGDLGDMLSGLFGGGAAGRAGGRGRRQAAERGDDLQVGVTVSFEDSLRGATVRVPVEKAVTCEVCRGTGAEPGTTPKVCPTCEGRGVVAQNQGFFALSQPCPTCHGNGTIVEHPCKACRGSGLQEKTQRYSVKIPAGAKDGTRIRIKGKGEAGRRGGQAGDLYVVVQRRTRPALRAARRRSRPRGAGQAQRGGARHQGHCARRPGAARYRSRCPPGRQDGRTLRVRGKGAPRIKGGQGDLLVRLRIAVPEKLTKEQRELLEKLGKSLPDPRQAVFGRA